MPRLAKDPRVIDDPNQVPVDVVGAGAVPADAALEPPVGEEVAPPPAEGAGTIIPEGPPPVNSPAMGAAEFGRQLELLTRRVVEIEQVLQEVLPQIVQMLAAHDQVLQEIMNIAAQAAGVPMPGGGAPPGGGPPMPGGVPPSGPPPVR